MNNHFFIKIYLLSNILYNWTDKSAFLGEIVFTIELKKIVKKNAEEGFSNSLYHKAAYEKYN